MGAKRTTPIVLEYFRRNANRNIGILEMSQETGLTEMQIKNAVANLRSREGIPIAVIVSGSMWKFDPRAEKTLSQNLYAEIGRTKSGAILLEDENGEIWRATRID